MDALIDPARGDYTLKNGALVRDPLAGLANAAYVRLVTPLGSYWADPTLGSRLHELQREKDVDRVSVLVRQYAEQALKPLLDDGRAAQIDVDLQRTQDTTHGGRAVLAIQITAVSGEVTSFQFPLKVI